MISFITYAGIISGLSAQGSNGARPLMFILSGEIYLYNAGKQNAFKWNAGTNTWDANTTLATFDVAPGDYRGGSAFWYNSDLYMILGGTATAVFGYKWSVANQRWEQNTAILSGFTPTTTYNHPTIFNIGSDMYLINGRSDGLFAGYKWNGSSWATNAGIISGLADVGTYSRPTTFYFGGELHFVGLSGFCYKWNTTSSQWDNVAFGSNLPTASASSFSSIDKDGVIHIVLGASSGGFNGYRFQSSSKVTSVTAIGNATCRAKLTVNLSEPLESGDSLVAYSAPDASGLGNPTYVVPLTQISDTLYEYQTSIQEGQYCYFRAVQVWSGLSIVTRDFSGSKFYILPVKTATVINITDTNNYKILNSPAHNYNHGSLFKDGYVYGSARNYPTLGTSDIFKVEAANYANIIYKTIYTNKNGSSGRISHFDQIIYAAGFLWTNVAGYLVRLNPSDLDYMVFSGAPSASSYEPMVSDGVNIFMPAGTSVYKLDLNYLTGSFASYGYTGAAAVAFPSAAIISSCLLIQHHPTINVYAHATVVDSQFIYLNCSQSSVGSGYDSGINMCHFQKIRKTDMVTVGDVTIPSSTDDMVQNGDYVFLCPEIGGFPDVAQLGYSWGLFAIKKTTLEIKYLKCLFPTENPSDKNGYGVFYLKDKIIVQTIAAKATVVVDISTVDQWGDYFPIGGATVAFYTFKLNNVAFAAAPNEFNLDNNGYAHSNKFEVNTLIFKFPLSLITTAVKEPNIATSLISSNENSATLGGYIIDEGNSPITSGGFKYGTAPEALTNDLPADPFSYDFTEVLSGLDAGIYYFKAYGTNTEGTFYGNTVMFSIEGSATYNAVSLHHNDTIALLEFVNAHYGCSIRCVQDAPGIATGTTGTVTDQDGNTYDTVVINEKRWMVQNLKTKKYRNGDSIPEAALATDWENAAVGAYCNVV